MLTQERFNVSSTILKTMFFSFSLYTSLFVSQLMAKTFTSQYCQFELPTGWECALEGTEWVCQSTNKQRQKEAIIILAAKIRGSQDSLEQYQAYLKKTKTFTLPDGKTQISDPKYAKVSSVNDHRWVDSLHLASEVPGFYTRYMATVKEDLGVAVTLSVAKDHYDSYRNIFDKVINTLRVFRQKSPDASNYRLAADEQNKDLIQDTQIIPDSGKNYGIGDGRQGRVGSRKDPLGSLIWIVAIVVVAGVVFAKLRKGKKKTK